MRLQKLAELLGSLYIMKGPVCRVFAQCYNSDCSIPAQHKSLFFSSFFSPNTEIVSKKMFLFLFLTSSCKLGEETGIYSTCPHFK